MSNKAYIGASFLALLLLYSTAPLAKSGRSVIKPSSPTVETPPPVGLYTPNLRQPGALIAFGENIMPQGETKFSFFANDYAGPGSQYIDLAPSLTYGITNQLSIDLTVPYAAHYTEGDNESSGIEDISLQLEYAYYTHSTQQYQDQATLVVNGTLPTGSDTKDPRTGNGSPTYFLGATYNRTYVEWLFFVSPGYVMTTTHDGTKYGDKFLYECGLGRNIFEIGKDWIFAWVAEFDGVYTSKTKVNGVNSPDSGGNVIFATPSLSLTGKQLAAQLGFGIPVVQDLNGQKNRTNYLIAANLSWIF